MDRIINVVGWGGFLYPIVWVIAEIVKEIGFKELWRFLPLTDFLSVLSVYGGSVVIVYLLSGSLRLVPFDIDLPDEE